MANGLFPFYNRPGIVKPRKLVTTKAKTGMIMIKDHATAPEGVTPCSSAGQLAVAGVISDPQGDPNDSGQFPVNSVINVAETGTIPVQLLADTYAEDDVIIASATAGCGKKLGAESVPYCVLGYYDDVPQTIGATTLLSVRLNIHNEQH